MKPDPFFDSPPINRLVVYDRDGDEAIVYWTDGEGRMHGHYDARWPGGALKASGCNVNGKKEGIWTISLPAKDGTLRTLFQQFHSDELVYSWEGGKTGG